MQVPQKDWDNTYNHYMDNVRFWLKENQEEVLTQLNTSLFLEMWNKYATGNLSTWEMSSMCCYYHEHELAHVDMNRYGFAKFSELPTEPEVDYFFKRNGRQIPIYKTTKIIGTVISKNDNKSSINLLTVEGDVVNVKFTREYYSKYKKQISEMQEDGKKKVKEKSWFTRGNLLMITGMRRDDQFVAKTYKHTPTHQIYKITQLNKDGSIEIVHERYGEEL